MDENIAIDIDADAGEERFAKITIGRLPLAALMARATFFDERGKSVPPVQDSGPSTGR